MKTLIIAEKPELARSIGEAICEDSKEVDGIIRKGEITIVSAFGHLLQLKEPEDYDAKYQERNDIDVLPIYFKNWKKIPTKDRIVFSKKQDNSYIRNRLKKIGELLNDTDQVIHAGDPDDEGQLLIDEIVQYFQFKGKVLRVLLNDNLKENIQKQFKHLEDNTKYIPIGNAAYARQMADMCFGINHSRLASIRLKRPLTVGRVQSPTLNLVVIRDQQVESHQKQTYYEAHTIIKIRQQECTFVLKPSKKILDGQEHVFDRKKIENALEKIKAEKWDAIEFVSKIKEEQPPLPYNATELQAEMNGRYGYSLSETLAITQILRDKYKAITYNRSDCQFLKEEHYNEANEVLPIIMDNIQMSFPVDLTIHSRCFDDNKISAHHAIIPQKKHVDIKQMTEKEKKVYFAICERYIMQFLPNLKKNTCKGRFEDPNGYGIWKYTSNYVIDKGYKKYFSRDEEVDQISPFFQTGIYNGEVHHVECVQKETAPPRRYTPKTLIKDMCGISKYVKDPKMKEALQAKDKGKEGENGSIGTVATRANIIENLIKRGYLEMKGKNIVSTNLGREFCALLPEDIKSADTTAMWWLMQEEIKEGKDPNSLMMSVVNDFNHHKEIDYLYSNLSHQARTNKSKEFGKCPICGKSIFKTKSKKTGKMVYFCSGFKEGCNFVLNENFKRFSDDIHLTDSKVEKLLKGGTITESLISKTGKSYKAKLKLVMKKFNGKYYPNLEIDSYIKS